MYVLSENLESVSQDEILALYNSVGWTKYTNNPENLMKAISNSTYVVTCYIGNTLIGFARAISDDSSICYIQDILVHPDHQGRGVGRKLLEKCDKRFSHVRAHVILTDDKERQKKFYESLGYKNTQSFKKTPLNCYVKFNE